jgi:hypothetical protein
MTQGCDQVVWLDAREHVWVEEMGEINLFFVYGPHGGRPRIMTRPDRDAAARRHPRLIPQAGGAAPSWLHWRHHRADNQQPKPLS